jgi:IclR family transcriptional regulator, acetate operon repressor
MPVNRGTTTAEPTASIQSLDRGLTLLEAFRTAPALSLPELAAVLPVHRTSTFRLVRTLERRGFLSQDAEGRYVLGPRVQELGSLALGRVDLRELARPYLRQLAAATGETVQLLLRDATDVVVVDVVESSHRLRVGAGLGDRLPLHATAAGKCFLAGMTPDAARALLGTLTPVTPHTIVDVDALIAEADRVSVTGYAVNDEESQSGARFVAAPIVGPERTCLAAISLGAPAERLLPTAIPTIGRQVVTSAAAISRLLGTS